MVEAPSDPLAFQWDSTGISGMIYDYADPIDQTGRSDWIRVDVVAGLTYNFYLPYLYPQDMQDAFTYMSLTDASGNALVQFETPFGGLYKASYTPSSDETIYVKAYNFDVGNSYG
ncbi:MAG: hypothetical protein ACREDP_10115, partial [Bradyrhizobium sp.]